MATAADISVFLTQVKSSLSSNNYKILDQRWKYRSTLSQLGIVDQDVIDDIRNLSCNENWIQEPDDNPSFPGDVWMCKKQLHGTCIYIKLKIQSSSIGLLLIMSYHIDGM